MPPIRLAAVPLLLCTGAAPAHDMWLHVEPLSPAPGDAVSARLHIGGHDTVEPMLFGPERIERLQVRSPAGTRTLDLPAPVAHVRVATEAAGTYTVAYESTPARSAMDAAEFEAYLREERLDAVLALHRAGGPYAHPVEERYSRSLKALVRLGDGPLVDCAMQLPLELSVVGAGRDGLLVRADFRGKPLAGLWLEHADTAGKMIEQQQTDAGGLARFAAGAGEWVLRATYMEAAAVAGTDWRSWWATTSFGWNGEDAVRPCETPHDANG